MINIKPATHALLEEYYGYAPKNSLRGYVVTEDEQIIAVTGLYIEKSRLVLFSDISPAVDRTQYRYRRTMVTMRKKLHAVMQTYHLPVHACADENVPGAGSLLEYYGFNYLHQGLYEWHQQQYH